MPDATAANRFHGARRTPSGATTSSYRVASVPNVGCESAATYSFRTGTTEILARPGFAGVRAGQPATHGYRGRPGRSPATGDPAAHPRRHAVQPGDLDD